jgi:hypothetical protein
MKRIAFLFVTANMVLCVVVGLMGPSVVAQELSLSDVRFVGGPDVSTFAQTTTISQVDVRANGVEVQFDKRDGANRWPDNTTPGWSGPLQYSVGLCMHLDGWICSAPIETWFGNNVVGGPIQSAGQIGQNWFYDKRWSPLNTHQPTTGEQLGIFVVAGDARNSFNPVRERSNIVTFTLPAPGATGTFTYSAQQAPQPTPQPTTTPQPAPTPSVDLAPILARLDGLEAAIQGLQRASAEQSTAIGAIGAEATDIKSKVSALESRTIPTACAASLNFGATRIPLSCTLKQ